MARTLNAMQHKSIEDKAKQFADVLGANEELNQEFQRAIVAKQEDRKSTAYIHFVIKDMFKPEEIAAWPALDSKEWEHAANSNEPYDRFKYKDNGTEKEGSFFRLTAQYHPIGAALKAQIKLIVDAVNGVKNEYTDMNKGLREARKKELNDDYTTFYSKFRLAVALFPAMTRANAEIDAVTVSYALVPRVDDTGKLVYGTDKKPEMVYADATRIIKVTNKYQPDVCEYFSIPNFLKLNVERALANGGKYEDYTTSNKRETEEPSGDKVPTINNVNEFESFVYSMCNYLEMLKSEPAKLGGVVQAFKGAGSDEKVGALFQLMEDMTIITMVSDIKKRGDQLLIDGFKRTKKAA